MNSSEPVKAPAPTEHRGSRRGTFAGWTMIALCLVVIFSVAATCLHGIGHKSNLVVAMNNGKSLMLALNDFASEYGGFPDHETAKAVRKFSGTTLDLDGDSANDYFRQLIAAGVCRSEMPFYANTSFSPKKPDNDMNGAEALRPGEVGFGYLMNGDRAMPNDDPDLIIAVAPLLNATTTGECDPEPLEGYAALLYLDSSVRGIRVIKGRQPATIRGHPLLHTGPGTIWGTAVNPVIKPPLTPPGWVAHAPCGTAANIGWWLAAAGATFALLALWVIRKRWGMAAAGG